MRYRLLLAPLGLLALAGLALAQDPTVVGTMDSALTNVKYIVRGLIVCTLLVGLAVKAIKGTWMIVVAAIAAALLWIILKTSTTLIPGFSDFSAFL